MVSLRLLRRPKSRDRVVRIHRVAARERKSRGRWVLSILPALMSAPLQIARAIVTGLCLTSVIRSSSASEGRHRI